MPGFCWLIVRDQSLGHQTLRHPTQNIEASGRIHAAKSAPLVRRIDSANRRHRIPDADPSTGGYRVDSLFSDSRRGQEVLYPPALTAIVRREDKTSAKTGQYRF